MTTFIYLIGAFLVFMFVVGFGQGMTLRKSLVSGLATCAVPLAIILLWIPYRVDLGAILQQSPVDEGSNRLTQAMLAFGCFFLAAICVAFWLSTKAEINGKKPDES